MKKNKIDPWLPVALAAMNIAFNSEDGRIKNNLSQEDKNKASQLLTKCIDELNANEAWPFIKLADLSDNPRDKLKLYIKSLEYDRTIYALDFIVKQIVIDHPDILNAYLVS